VVQVGGLVEAVGGGGDQALGGGRLEHDADDPLVAAMVVEVVGEGALPHTEDGVAAAELALRLR
jgi:hypothetical protein